MTVTLLAGSLASFAAFVFLIWVGWVVAARPVGSRRTQLALSAFAGWWYALAASSGVSALTDLLVATGDPPLSLVMGLQFLNVAAICMGLAGLLYYLLYFYTGRSWWFWPLAIGYALAAGLLIRMLAAWRPLAVVATPWRATIEYAAASSGASLLIMLLVLIGPQLLASLGLFALAARLPRSGERVRLRVVGVAIFAWFGGTLVAMVAGFTDAAAWQVLQMWVPFLVGLSVLLVHRPPPWLARRLPPDLSSGSPDSLLSRSY